MVAWNLALANIPTPPAESSKCSNHKCDGFLEDPDDDSIYTNAVPGKKDDKGNDPIFFVLGTCTCDTGNATEEFNSYKKVDPPGDDETVFIHELPDLEHTGDEHDIPVHDKH